LQYGQRNKPKSIKIIAKSSSNSIFRWIFAYSYFAFDQGRSDGGYMGIYTPPNQSTLNFLCGCFVSLQ